MRIEVLVSTMNLNDMRDVNELRNRMNLNEKNSLIINQNIKKNLTNIMKKSFENNNVYTYKELGISNSRNRAISLCKGDICVIADDDLEYTDNFESVIKKAFNEYKDADIIAFYVENAKDINSLRKGKIDYIHSMKICSVQLALNIKKINSIKFDTNFGTGSEFFQHGEENIFLYDSLKKNLKIYYYPCKIATLKDKKSSWFKGFNIEFFESTGAMFYRMSKLFYWIYIFQFAIRKRKFYKDKISIYMCVCYMFNGVKKYKNIIECKEKK